MKKIILLILIFSIFLNFSYSQIIFQKTYGGVNDDVFVDFEKTDDNGLLLLGYTNSFGMGENDIILTKLNSEGDIQWSKLYGNAGNDTGHDIKKINNGDFIICGATTSSGAGGDDIYILRVDNNGNLLWSKTYGGSDWEQPRGRAVETANGDFIIISTTLSFGAGAKDIHFLRISSSGDMLLTKTYGGGNNDWVHDFIPMDNGDIIIGGRINHTSNGSFGGLLRIDETGNVLWAKSYNTSGFCKFYRLKESDNGNIIAVGRIDSYGAGNADLYVITTDQNGELLWAKTYGGNSYEFANGVDITSNQKIIFSGYTESFGFGGRDIFLIKIDNNGNFTWGKIYGGIENDYTICGADLLNYNNSAYYINGMTTSFGMGNKDMYLIKTDTAGNSGCNEQDFFPTITSPSIMVNPIQIYTGSGGIENNPNTIVNDLVLPFYTLCIVYSPVALFFASDTILCTNNCIDFIDSSLYNPDYWSWYFEGGIPSYSNVQNPSNICYYSPGKFDVKLVVSNQYGSDSIYLNDYITVHPSPAINLGNDTTICSNDSIILCPGSGYSSYLWQDGSCDSTYIVDTTGLYWVEVTDINGCTAIDSIIITFFPSPEINLGNDTSICFGDSLILNVGTGYESYLWQDGSTDSTYIVDTTGIYWIEVSNEYGCITRDTIIISFYPDPQEDLELGNDTSFCFGEYIILNAGSGYTSYLWQDGSTDSTCIADTSGIYWVMVTNPCGSAVDSIVLTVFPLPVINLGNDTSVCYGEYIFLDPGPDYTCLWQDGSTNPTYNAGETGIYWVEVTDG
ncbi:MAG: hypothetical protein K8R58_07970, partial [Bacteroidales bacterium]|nr:hypothetical protein [Bacteroidales bacterium]